MDPSETTTTTTPVPAPAADSAAAAPTWVLIALILIVGFIIVAAFFLTIYNMSAPRSTLKTLLGVSGVWHRKQDRSGAGKAGAGGAVTPIGLAAREVGSTSELVTTKLLKSLSLSARVNTRTTRTTLAIVGFALLGVIVIVVFAISGAGVRDLRSQVVAGVITLVATIGGFYFGSRSNSDGAGAAAAPNAGGPAIPPSPPTIAPDPTTGNTAWTVGTAADYRPVVGGSPAPQIGHIGGLPPGLTLDPQSGRISGTPTTEGAYTFQLVATNQTGSAATITVTLTVTAAPATPAGSPT